MIFEIGPFLGLVGDRVSSVSFLFSISHITWISSYSQALTSWCSFNNPLLRIPRRTPTPVQTLRREQITLSQHSIRTPNRPLLLLRRKEKREQKVEITRQQIPISPSLFLELPSHCAESLVSESELITSPADSIPFSANAKCRWLTFAMGPESNPYVALIKTIYQAGNWRQRFFLLHVGSTNWSLLQISH